MEFLRKTAAAVTAACLCMSVFSADCPVSADTDITEYEGYDISRMENLISDFEKSLEISGNDEEVRNYYHRIIDEMDYVSLQMLLADLQYSQNTVPENLDIKNAMSVTGMQCDNMIKAAFIDAYLSDYQTLTEELLYEGYIQDTDEIYSIEEETKEYLTEKNKLLSAYSTEIFSSDSAEQKNLKCAEIYLDLVRLYNSRTESDEYTYLDYAYQLYDRDYTPEEIGALNDAAAEAAQKAYMSIAEYAVSLPYDNNITFENNIEIIDQFSYRISDELKESAAEIKEKKLYKTGSGSLSEDMTYTVALSYYDTAVIYQYLYGVTGDLSVTAHEFGHFNAMRLNSIPYLYTQSHNLDLAEIQSQGLEVLYTYFYDSIFGEYAEYQKMSEASNLIISVSAGFFGNEFEQYVFENADSLTPEQVLEKYSELQEKYAIYRFDLYQIPHFFQYPGYYISYAVSALAAVNLWDVMYRDFDRASEMYTDLTHIPSYNGAGYFEALESAGFDNLLDAEHIRTVLSDFSGMLTSGLVYGDTDGNGVLNMSDVIYLITAVISPDAVINDNNRPALDVTDDGQIDSADIIKLKSLLAG